MAPRYYFHLFNDTVRSDDETGVMCDDLSGAFQHAMQIASELSVSDEDWGTVVEVCDSDGAAIGWFCSGETVIATRAGELSVSTLTASNPSVEMDRNSLEATADA